MKVEPGKSVSISFEDAYQIESIPLFSSTMGMELVDLAKIFIKEIVESGEDINEDFSGYLMARFIVWLEHNDMLEYEPLELYLGEDKYSGRNEDFGHHVISILTTDVFKTEVCK